MKIHRVTQGETVASIAERHGFPNWDKVYLASENQDLRRRRPNPNVLYPGDQLAIPDLETKTENGDTGRSHVFKAGRTHWTFRLVLRDEADEPMANEDWELIVNGESITGTTAADGLIEAQVPASILVAKLQVLGEEMTVRLGDLDPVTRLAGVQQRLNNLGYSVGAEDGVLGPNTQRAVMAFQAEAGLERTGQIDDETRRALLTRHDGDERLADFEEESTGSGRDDDGGENTELAEDDSDDPSGEWMDPDEEALNEALEGEEPLDAWWDEEDEGME